MTAAASTLERMAAEGRSRPARRPLPPLSRRMELVRLSLMTLLVLSASFVLELVVVSRFEEHSSQQLEFASLRAELAQGTAPIGPTDSSGRELVPGTPMAYLEIPSIGLHQVVVQGTAAGDLFNGPGHRRDTAFPGQAGVSVLLGRRASFGAPFSGVSSLRKGATIRVTTGQGKFNYKVIGVRREGDPLPATLATGAGRLLLATASGRSFVPSGVLRVDADLTTPALGGAAPLLTSQTLPATEQLMAADPSTLWALALWLQFLIVAVLAAAWAWHRWGKPQAWVVFLPLLLLLGLNVSEQAARLLPNLL